MGQCNEIMVLAELQRNSVGYSVFSKRDLNIGWELTDAGRGVSRPFALPSTHLSLGAIQPVILSTWILHQAAICCGPVEEFITTVVGVGRCPTVYVFTCRCLAWPLSAKSAWQHLHTQIVSSNNKCLVALYATGKMTSLLWEYFIFPHTALTYSPILLAYVWCV